MKDSELLRIFDNIKKVEDVEKLNRVYPDLVPPISRSYEENLPSTGVETLQFN